MIDSSLEQSTFKGWFESSGDDAVAYYTNDLQDAYETGLFMTREPKVNED